MGGSYSSGEYTTGLEQLNGGHGMFILLCRAILKGHWDGGRDRKKCVLINYHINKGGPSRWVRHIAGGGGGWVSALLFRYINFSMMCTCITN